MTVTGNADRLLASRPVRIGLAIGIGLAARAVTGRASVRPTEGLVDWERAQRIAQRRLMRAPGHLTEQQLRFTRAAYARHMARVVPLLEARLGAALPGVVERHAVASRTEWAAANMGTFQALVAHLEPSLMPRGGQGRRGTNVAAAANRFLTTSQVGFLLGYLGTRVLGQYDVALLSAEQAPGRLLYVEENIRSAARSASGSACTRPRTPSRWRRIPGCAPTCESGSSARWPSSPRRHAACSVTGSATWRGAGVPRPRKAPGAGS
jgi:hypothetical protein